jgi:anthranilate synthase component 2
MLLMIDNYDSFTYNLVQYLGELGAELEVYRNDAITVDEVERLGPAGIVVSPGPGTPSQAGVTVPVIRRCGDRIPILGVCLGHQAIGQAFGGKVVRATPLHGKVSDISHKGTGVFRGINGSLKATRYHSLVVERASMPNVLTVNAETADHLVMGLMHETLPVHGVQFHPESIASEHGHLMLRNFLELAAAWNARRGRDGTKARKPAALQAT